MGKEFKILFIYPSFFMLTSLPLGISTLAAALKERNIQVKIFDTIFYQETGEIDQNIERAEKLRSVKKIDYKSAKLFRNESDPIEDFKNILLEYAPDLIALSATEGVFERGIKFTREAKKITNIPVIAGGVFPTLAPETAIQEDSIDMICIGEGEDVLVELCECLRDGRDYSDVKGLWIKKNNYVKKNELMPLKSLDSVTAPDFSDFDPRIFYRPMQGNLFKTIPIEFSRGCPYKCTYCAEPSLSDLYKSIDKGMYFRKKSMANVLSEIERNIKQYSPEFFYFSSETFLAISEKEFDEFIKGYEKIKIPFWIQTRPETISYEKIKRLQGAGLFHLTIGIEHGNESFCRKYLKRNTKNEEIIKAVKILDKANQGVSVNNIIGFPLETRELIFDTIMFNRELWKINKRVMCNVSIFTPFRGCELYNLCTSNGLFEPVPYISHSNVDKGTLLKFASMTKEDIDGLFRTFNLYVHLPEEFFGRIRLAEKFTPEGNDEYTELNDKFMEYACQTR